VSELLGLRWGHIDFDAGVMNVLQGIVYNVVGQPKSDSSRSRIPLAASVLDSRRGWRSETPYAAQADWVFASPRMKGKKPYRANTLVANHLKVATAKAGNSGPVGLAYVPPINLWLADRQRRKREGDAGTHATSSVKNYPGLYAKAATPSKRRAHERSN
jgi:integrase